MWNTLKTCAANTIKQHVISSGRVCTSISTASVAVIKYLQIHVLRPICCVRSPQRDQVCFFLFFLTVERIRSYLRPHLLWIWRRYRLRRAKGSQRNPYVIHGHGAGGCCCCSLQIAAHLAWLSLPEQEGDVFIMITAFSRRGGFMSILRPGNKK